MTYTVLPIEMPNYEKRLDANRTWALREGGMFFQNESEVQKSLRRITDRLRDLGIDYAVVGGMALFLHGYRRFAEDVDLLVTPDGLAKVHAALEGSGYRQQNPKSEHLRDAENSVRICLHRAEGKRETVEREGVTVLSLPGLIAWKLAYGVSGTARLKDLADVQELIKSLRLPLEYQDNLLPGVRTKYLELWVPVSKMPGHDQ